MTENQEQPEDVREIDIRINGELAIKGFLTIPEGAGAIVLFAHGSGSSRFSPRNRYVASVLEQAGLATLLMDLLTKEEEAIDLRTGELRFDIGLLARRVIGATEWLLHNPDTSQLRIGYFGASTGAAAALVAAAQLGQTIAAIVSRGGRPDLAGPDLSKVVSSTLLIVGGNDSAVIDLNQQALELLPSAKELLIIPGAGHLFEEPGTLEQAAQAASRWFTCHFSRQPANKRQRSER